MDRSGRTEPGRTLPEALKCQKRVRPFSSAPVSPSLKRFPLGSFTQSGACRTLHVYQYSAGDAQLPTHGHVVPMRQADSREADSARKPGSRYSGFLTGFTKTKHSKQTTKRSSCRYACLPEPRPGGWIRDYFTRWIDQRLLHSDAELAS